MIHQTKKGKTMKQLLALTLALALSACMYSNPANYERYYGNSDITKVDWTKIDSEASACQYNWLGFIPTGNQSLARAVEYGDIAKIVYVDTDTVVMFPLFIAECTNVYGTKSDEAKDREARIAAEREARRTQRRGNAPETIADVVEENE
jgi:hypothetical protein